MWDFFSLILGMNYIEVTFEIENNTEREILIAKLYHFGFESFEENDTTLKAFICQNNFIETEFANLIESINIKYSKSVIKQQNWNKIWESDFKPVCINGFVGIRAEFHEPLQGFQHEIIITPKMSFGTGHHATTFLMIQAMKEIDFRNKSVLDFGTGTAVLAILAEKLGAIKVDAIDYDEFCIENASENTVANNCRNITVIQSNSAETNKKYDIILANINRNIILDNLKTIANQLNKKSELLLSGLLNTDEEEVLKATKYFGLTFLSKYEKEEWICLQFKY